MRIVHAIRSLAARIGGPPMVAINIAARQLDAGHDVQLIYEDLGGELIRLPDQLVNDRLIVVPSRTISSRLVDSDFARVAEPVLEQADIVHVHGIWRRVPFRCMRFARLARIPFLISPHGMLNEWALKQNPMRKKAAFLLGTWNLIEQANGIHALSQYELDCIVKHRLDATLTKIPNGVDLSEIYPLPEKGTFRRKYPQLNRDGQELPFLLFLARLHPGKRLDLLVDAFAKVAENIPDLRLVIVGPDFGAQADVESRIHHHQLESKVVLTGPIWGKEKYEPLVDATAYCLPSEHESFSVAIVEALASGCPVIISQECHFPEVRQSDSGLVTALDIDEIAKAMHEIVTNHPRRNQMAENAANLVRENYQWETIADQLTQFYQQLVDSRSTSRSQTQNQTLSA